jgi:hypothetical protein
LSAALSQALARQRELEVAQPPRGPVARVLAPEAAEQHLGDHSPARPRSAAGAQPPRAQRGPPPGPSAMEGEAGSAEAGLLRQRPFASAAEIPKFEAHADRVDRRRDQCSAAQDRAKGPASRPEEPQRLFAPRVATVTAAQSGAEEPRPRGSRGGPRTGSAPKARTSRRR